MPKDLGEELLILLAGHFTFDYSSGRRAHTDGPRAPSALGILDPIFLAALILAARWPNCKLVAGRHGAKRLWIAHISAVRFKAMMQQTVS
jgi:hypothetical protein